MWRSVIWAGLAFGLGGCQTAKISASFDPEAAAYIHKTGTGTIEGQAFLRRDYGRLVTAAGERVFLIPATSYAVERFNRMFGGDMRSYYGNSVDEAPPEYYRYRRETKADMSGKFTFEKVWPGRYIVATRIFWTEPRSYLTRGGAIYDTVDVKKDESAQAIISGK